MFVDALGHEHNGHIGDYLVESSDGTCRVAPREIFEDIYVPMAQNATNWQPRSQVPVTRMKRRLSLRPEMQA